MFIVAAFCLAGCDSKPKSKYGNKKLENISFADNVATNAEIKGSLNELQFVGTDGEKVTIKDFVGKNLLVVITRGFTTPICPFCQTQTSRLVSNYGRFQELDTEVLLVYPGKKGQLEQFLQTVKTVDKGQIENVPFKVLLDDGLDAVKFFDIEENRAFPATYIFDKDGKTRFAYVGGNPGDRPSINAIIEQLKLLEN
jgi:peroxiredoxin